MKSSTIDELKRLEQQLFRLGDDPAGATCRALIQQAKAALRRPITFRSPSPCRYVIGYPGQELNLESDLVGLAPMWMAFSRPPGGVSVLDACGPDVKKASDVVRTSIRGPSSEWLDQVARCPALAAEALKIKIIRGRAVYHPDRNSPVIHTGIEI